MRDPNYMRKRLIWPAVCLALLASSGAVPSARGAVPDPNAGIADEDMPPGVASSWLLGRQLLGEGQTEDALPFLHFAYRAQPGVQAIAMTFQEALANGGYIRDAIEVMDQLVAAWPDSQSYLLRRASLNLQAGNRDRALEDLAAIRERGITTPEGISAEATLLAAAGKPDRALKVFRQAIELFPDQQPRFYLGMASILQQEGKMTEVPGLMGEALESNSADAGLWLVRIRSLASLQQYKEAVETVRQATERFADLVASQPDSATGAAVAAADGPVPDTPEYFYIELADYYAQHGELERAVDLLGPLSQSRELGLAPSLWLGRLYLGTGRTEEGTALVHRILEQWPGSARAWFLRGKVAENTDDWSQAVPHYRKAARLGAHDPEIRLGLVRALLVAEAPALDREPADAETDSLRAELHRHAMVASMITPDADAEGQLILGYAFLTLDDYERGAYRFQLAGENRDLRVTALTQKSICEDRMNEFARARQSLEILRREYPDDPEVANSLGYFLAEKGQDLELAEDLIREALEVQPGNGAFLDSLGWVYYRLGRYEDALDQLIRAVNVLPEDPVILEHVGLTLLELEKYTEAEDILVRALGLGADRKRVESALAEVRRHLPDPAEGR